MKNSKPGVRSIVGSVVRGGSVESVVLVESSVYTSKKLSMKNESVFVVTFILIV